MQVFENKSGIQQRLTLTRGVTSHRRCLIVARRILKLAFIINILALLCGIGQLNARTTDAVINVEAFDSSCPAYITGGDNYVGTVTTNRSDQIADSKNKIKFLEVSIENQRELQELEFAEERKEEANSDNLLMDNAAVVTQEAALKDQQNFLKTLFRHCTKGYLEIRTMSKDWKVTGQKWYSLDTEQIDNLPDTEHVFIGVATREENKGTKDDLVQIPAAHVDVDFKDIEQSEVDRLIGEATLKPSIIVNSGNGYHLYHVLNTPGTKIDIPRIEAINKRLAKYYGGDERSVEAARILRLPETNNIKYKESRPVTVKSINDMAYSIDDLDNLFPVQPPETLKALPSGNSDDYYTKVLRDGVHEGERHSALVKLASHYRHADIREYETQILLEAWNEKNKQPLPLSELQKTIADVYKRYGEKVNDPIDMKSIMGSAIVRVNAFVGKQITPKPFIIEPLIKQSEIIMLSAARGVGKTMLALSLGFAATRPAEIGKWKTKTPTGTLYVDGEISEEEMQDRLIKLKLFRQREEKPFYLMSSDYMRANDMKIPNLSDKFWRDFFDQFLMDHPEIGFVIFDNIASLTPGRDENKKTEWDNINQWFLKLRSKGIAVLFLHHLGKGGDQRGTSAIEDNINFSIKLKRPEGYQSHEGCKFIVEYSKSRRLYGDDVKPFTMELQNEGTCMELKIVDDTGNTKAEQIEQLLKKGGLRQKEIAEIVGVDPSYVTEIKKQMVKSERMKAVTGGYDNKSITGELPEGQCREEESAEQHQEPDKTSTKEARVVGKIVDIETLEFD